MVDLPIAGPGSRRAPWDSVTDYTQPRSRQAWATRLIAMT